MAEPTNVDYTIIDLEDDRPLAVRRKRRISTNAGQNALLQAQIKPENNGTRAFGIATPPATPHRSKKRVRFSEPGSSTTGLTPFFGRSLLSSPPPSRARRQCTPSSSRWNLAVDDTPIISGTLQFAPFRQVLEGRVKRRIRRNRLSEELNIIKTEEKNERKSRKGEIELLKEELRQKNQEITSMRDEQDLASQIGGEAGIPSLNTAQLDSKINHLESQVADLQAELQRRESVAPDQGGPNLPSFVHDVLDDDDDFMQDFNDDFNGGTDLFLSTPAGRSFPSPPMSMPNTPSKPTLIEDVNEALENDRKEFESQLHILQEELKTLSETLELTNTTHERLSAKLLPYLAASNYPGEPESLDAALDAVLTQLALSQSATLDNATRYSALTNELKDLFPSSAGAINPEVVLQTLHTQFRAARLELEYLAPGENVEGFENSKLLDMLVSRLRTLTKRVSQQDQEIDQYHSQEVSLRKQLGSRVDAMNYLQDSLSHAQSDTTRLEADLNDRDDSISKLTNTLQGYRDEVSGLEMLVNRLEVDHAADLAILRSELDSSKREAESKTLDAQLQRDTLTAAAEGREMLMLELEQRLSAALSSSQALEAKLAAAQQDRASAVAQLRESACEREREHGEALAIRDGRVSELREEVERINGSLKEAHETIVELKREKRELRLRLEGDWMRARHAIDEMGGHLAAPRESRDRGDVNDAMSVTAPSPLTTNENGDASTGPIPVLGATVVRSGGLLFNASLARRRSSKKRRRYDSGLGFLDEMEEEEALVDVA